MPIGRPSTRGFYASFAAVPRAERPLQLLTLASTGQYRHAYELVPRYLGNARAVLDWGCGNGHFARFLLTQGLDVTGYSYDPPPSFVAGAERFHFVPGTAGDPCALPFADAQFDAVFSIGVLEHVHELAGDQRRSMAELLRVLRPGGRAFIFHLPNRGSWIEAVVRVTNGLGLTAKHQHSLRFTRASFTALLEGHAARVIAEGRYNILPRNALRLLPAGVGDAPMLCGAVNAVDDALGAVAPALCQNWYFIVEKAGGAGAALRP